MRSGTKTLIAATAIAAVAATIIVAAPDDRVPAGAADRAFEASLVSLDGAARAEAQQIALRGFDDCGELLDYFKDEAATIAGPYGGGLFAMRRGVAFDTATSAVAAESAGNAPLPATVPATVDDGMPFSQTNVQEQGVDEPDSIKTDGETIFLVQDDRVVAVRAGDDLAELGRIRLKDTWGAQLLLAGDRLLAIGSDGGYAVATDTTKGIAPAGKPWRARTGVRVIDVSDPSNMSIVETLWVEGWFVAARMVDGIARVVVRTDGAALDLPAPLDPSGSLEEAERLNRRAIERSDLDDWLPRYEVTPGESAPADGDPMTSCGRVRRPVEFGGLSMVSVMTVDPADPTPREVATVVGAGETVYASQTGLYVTTNEWNGGGPVGVGVGRAVPELVDPPAIGSTAVEPDTGVASDDIAPEREPDVRTVIHRFDISDPRGATYQATGEVPGSVLNQWSLSEHEGNLRVVTTTGGFSDASESRVTVLERRGPLLRPIGDVRGLGETERVYAVRFMGDTAYVVTFRQVDPLYVIDLSDPANPVQRGELKIPGFSSYLHPVADGRLVGLGQDASLDGRVRGLQTSLFDVADPDDPRRVDTLGFGPDTYSIAQDDAHAFLWWAPANVAVFPVSGFDARSGVSVNRAQIVRVDGDTLVDAGAIAHPVVTADGTEPGGGGKPSLVDPVIEDRPIGYAPDIQRALVIGERLYTVSPSGVMVNDLASLAEVDWLAWAQG